jgi:pyridoxal/pyridoxine/pyridoxamine kinase
MTHVSEQSTTFNPETLHILGSALDDAWQRLEVRVHLNGSGDAFRTLLDVTFNPETRHILGSALDDAWQRLEVRVHLNGGGDAIRTILAQHIIAMAEEGERDRQRLIEGALARLKLWTRASSSTPST